MEGHIEPVVGVSAIDNPIFKWADAIWNKVIESTRKVLQECAVYGITEVLSVPDPNAERRLEILRGLLSVVDAILAAAEARNQTDCVRMLLNSKQQIVLLERLVVAAKTNDVEEFEQVRAQMERQAGI